MFFATSATSQIKKAAGQIWLAAFYVLQFQAMPEACSEDLVGFHFGWLDVDTAAIAIEVDFAIGQGEQGVIVPHADMATGMPFRSNLTDQDVTGQHRLTTKFFHATALCI